MSAFPSTIRDHLPQIFVALAEKLVDTDVMVSRATLRTFATVMSVLGPLSVIADAKSMLRANISQMREGSLKILMIALLTPHIPELHPQ